jgi:pSer/pThr/pTyr-binding forkhead associated (FHA) protein
MVLLQILTGSEQQQVIVSKSPFRIGRSPEADLQLEQTGVWSEHAQLSLDAASSRIFISACAEAVVFVNGERISHHPLRNGDLLQIGSAQLIFALAPARQIGLKFWQSLSWALLLIVTAVQVVLIYRLVR